MCVQCSMNGSYPQDQYHVCSMLLEWFISPGHPRLPRRAHPEGHLPDLWTGSPTDLRPHGAGARALGGQQAADLRLSDVSVGGQLQHSVLRHRHQQGAGRPQEGRGGRRL